MRGHIRKNCPDLPSDDGGGKKGGEPAVVDKAKGKGLLLDLRDKVDPFLARIAVSDGYARRGASRGAGRGGGRVGKNASRRVNPNNPHMTQDVRCTFDGIYNHTEAQCWTKHKHLVLAVTWP